MLAKFTVFGETIEIWSEPHLTSLDHENEKMYGRYDYKIIHGPAIHQGWHSGNQNVPNQRWLEVKPW